MNDVLEMLSKEGVLDKDGLDKVQDELSRGTRLEEARNGTVAWKKWGPYLSERQWGTVREDYSADGNTWD